MLLINEASKALPALFSREIISKRIELNFFSCFEVIKLEFIMSIYRAFRRKYFESEQKPSVIIK